MKMVVINGAPRAGKDTFVELCQSNADGRKVGNVSTVDFVKEVATFCGWDGTKTLANRAFLSSLKDLLTEWNDVPLHKIGDYVARHIDYDVIFVHCREPREIEKLVNTFDAKTLLIRRPQADESEKSNHADIEVFNYNYDTTITNDGTIDDLARKAHAYLAKIIK